MKISEARAAVLRKLNTLSMNELRQPGRSSLYDTHQILRMIALSLPEDQYAYIRDSNNLVRASLEAAIDKSIREREDEARRPLRRRARR